MIPAFNFPYYISEDDWYEDDAAGTITATFDTADFDYEFYLDEEETEAEFGGTIEETLVRLETDDGTMLSIPLDTLRELVDYANNAGI